MSVWATLPADQRKQGAAASAIAAALLALAPDVAAQSAPAIEDTLATRAERALPLPLDFDPVYALIASSPSGEFALASSQGSEANIVCALLFTAGEQARHVVWRHLDQPTVCVGMQVGQGAVFVRALNPTLNSPQPSGWTSRIDADGRVSWTVEDTRLINEPSAADGGAGQFRGRYARPSPIMALDRARQMVVGATEATLVIGPQEKTVSQLHIVHTETGRLTRSGQTFGRGGISDLRAVASLPDAQRFLVAIAENAMGTSFVRYDGRGDVDAASPGARDWSDRRVEHVSVSADQAIALAWSDAGVATDPTRIALVRADGALAWSAQAPADTRDELGARVEIGRPLGLWHDARFVVATYEGLARLWSRWWDAETGALVAEGPLDQIIQSGDVPIGIVYNTDGELSTMALDPVERQLIVSRVGRVGESPDPMRDADGGASADMGQMPTAPAPDSAADEGCGCGSVQRRARASWWWWIALITGLLGARLPSRRASRRIAEPRDRRRARRPSAHERDVR